MQNIVSFSSSVDIAHSNENEVILMSAHIWPDCNHNKTGKIACTYPVFKKIKENEKTKYYP
jgi:hypothetical protein